MITTSGWIAIGIGVVVVVVGTIAIYREWLDLQDSKQELERLQYNKFQCDNHDALNAYKFKE